MQYAVVEERYWERCVICNTVVKDMKNEEGRYWCWRFVSHIKKHGLSIEDYFEKYCGLEIPKCICGCGKRIKVNNSGRQLVFMRYVRGHADRSDPKWIAHIERMKRDRVGKGNPMFGKESWNKGQTRATNTIVNRIAKKITGLKASEDTRKKQSQSAKKRKVHGHTGHKHSEETKNKIRQTTLQQIKDGVFSQLRSKPQRIVAQILDDLHVSYIEEKQEGKFVFDFFVPMVGLYIEVDGDYFHSNPKFYPEGPETKTQRVNWFRDIKKDDYSRKQGLRVARFWEDNIINDRQEVIAKLNAMLGGGSAC